MQRITETVIRLGLSVALAISITGCGIGTGYELTLGDGWCDGPDSNIVVYDGQWRGDYVYYLGDWYYRGYGTPYMYMY
jgi:hypothetical protein